MKVYFGAFAILLACIAVLTISVAVIAADIRFELRNIYSLLESV
jgi:hypothetical protein